MALRQALAVLICRNAHSWWSHGFGDIRVASGEAQSSQALASHLKYKNMRIRRTSCLGFQAWGKSPLEGLWHLLHFPPFLCAQSMCFAKLASSCNTGCDVALSVLLCTTVPKGLCPPVGMELPGIGIRSWAPELTLGPGLFVTCRTESTKMSCCVASGAQSWLRVQYVLGTETQRLALRGDGTAGRALAGPTLPPASLTGHLPAGALAAMTVCSSRL